MRDPSLDARVVQLVSDILEERPTTGRALGDSGERERYLGDGEVQLVD
jgi:hypothetical protein